ncbi:MAG: hypothetical protein U9Q31_00440 [Chloroflexota bacterium]|nr:hypothetical protein [Chloroflexota bacterium]
MSNIWQNAPRRKLVVIVLEKMDRKDVLTALKRYLAVIFFAVAGSGVIELLTTFRGEKGG